MLYNTMLFTQKIKSRGVKNSESIYIIIKGNHCNKNVPYDIDYAKVSVKKNWHIRVPQYCLIVSIV